MTVTIPDLRKVATRRRFLIGSVAAGAGALAAMAAADSGLHAPRARAQEVPQDPPPAAAPPEGALPAAPGEYAALVSPETPQTFQALVDKTTDGRLRQPIKEVSITPGRFAAHIRVDMSNIALSERGRGSGGGIDFTNDKGQRVSINRSAAGNLYLYAEVPDSSGNPRIINDVVAKAPPIIDVDLSINNENGTLTVNSGSVPQIHKDYPDFGAFVNTERIKVNALVNGGSMEVSTIEVLGTTVDTQATVPDSPVAQVAQREPGMYQIEHSGKRILYYTDFKGSIGSGFSDYTDGLGIIGHRDGEYEVRSYASNPSGAAQATHKDFHLENGHIEMTFRLESGNYAIVQVRKGWESRVNVSVNPHSQRVGASSVIGKERVQIMPSTYSAAVRPGNLESVLGVRMEGSVYKVYCNGVYVGSANDTRQTAGGLGLSVQSTPGQEGILRVKKLIATEL